MGLWHKIRFTPSLRLEEIGYKIDALLKKFSGNQPTFVCESPRESSFFEARNGFRITVLWFVICPRIEQQHTCRREVFGVPGHDVQAVASRRSSNETVACGNDLTGSLRGGCEFSPGVASFEIDGQDAVGVVTFEGLQPCLEFTFVLAFLEKSNSFGDFSDGYDTDKQTVVFESYHRTADARMPLGVAQFGKHAGIEKHSHNFTSRIGAPSRARSSPSRLGPSPIRKSLNPRRLPVSFS